MGWVGVVSDIPTRAYSLALLCAYVRALMSGHGLISHNEWAWPNKSRARRNAICLSHGLFARLKTYVSADTWNKVTI